MHRLAAFSLLTVLFAAATFLPPKVVLEKDIPYLDPSRPEKLDIYYPTPSKTDLLPAVLLIHGGGWKSGDKADPRGISISNYLASFGYVVFAINYKLSTVNGDTTTASWPQNFYDSKSALRFIRQNARHFGVDPTRIAVMGESAGGHLALLVGATANADNLNRGGLYTDQSNAVSCIVDMYGIPDLVGLSAQKPWIKPPFAGQTEAGTYANLTQASPVTWFSPQTPPTLIIHGTDDPTVPYAESAKLAVELQKLNVPTEFITVPDTGHAFNLTPKAMDLRPRVHAFLDKCFARPAP